MNRADANKQLMLPGNSNGTFLVRESRGAYQAYIHKTREMSHYTVHSFVYVETSVLALSIRYTDPKRPTAMGIRHYKIRFSDDKKSCFISKNEFNNVQDLIENYKGNSLNNNVFA